MLRPGGVGALGRSLRPSGEICSTDRDVSGTMDERGVATTPLQLPGGSLGQRRAAEHEQQGEEPSTLHRHIRGRLGSGEVS